MSTRLLNGPNGVLTVATTTVLAIAVVAPARADFVWSPPSSLDTARYVTPVAAVLSPDASVLTAVWQRSLGVSGALLVATSDNGGATWTAPRFLTRHRAKYPVVVGSRTGTLVAAWRKGLGHGRAVIEAARSGDGGRSWSPAVQVSTARQQVRFPQVAAAANGRRAAVGWIQGHRGAYLVATSWNGAVSFRTPKEVATAGRTEVRLPRLLISGNGKQVTAAWTRGPLPSTVRLQLATSRDKGRHWDAARTVGRMISEYDLRMSADGRRIVTARLSAAGRVLMTTSADAGRSWSAAPPTGPEASGVQVALSRDGSLAAVLWIEHYGDTSRQHNLMARSFDGGRTWAPSWLPAAPGLRTYTLTTSDGGELALVREDGSGTWSTTAPPRSDVWSVPRLVASSGAHDGDLRVAEARWAAGMLVLGTGPGPGGSERLLGYVGVPAP